MVPAVPSARRAKDRAGRRWGDSRDRGSAGVGGGAGRPARPGRAKVRAGRAALAGTRLSARTAGRSDTEKRLAVGRARRRGEPGWDATAAGYGRLGPRPGP